MSIFLNFLNVIFHITTIFIFFSFSFLSFGENSMQKAKTLGFVGFGSGLLYVLLVLGSLYL